MRYIYNFFLTISSLLWILICLVGSVLTWRCFFPCSADFGLLFFKNKEEKNFPQTYSLISYLFFVFGFLSFLFSSLQSFLSPFSRFWLLFILFLKIFLFVLFLFPLENKEKARKSQFHLIENWIFPFAKTMHYQLTTASLPSLVVAEWSLASLTTMLNLCFKTIPWNKLYKLNDNNFYSSCTLLLLQICSKHPIVFLLQFVYSWKILLESIFKNNF